MSTTLQPGDMVPGRALRAVGGGPPVRIGPNRLRTQVLVVTHADPCDGCAEYLESLGTQTASLSTRKADVVALVGAGWEDRWSSPVRGGVVDAAVVALAPESTPVVAVVDRFGQVFTRVDAGDDHAFPEHDQLFGALLDIAIRCPECGVPDVPSPDLLPEAGTRSGGMVLGQ